MFDLLISSVVTAPLISSSCIQRYALMASDLHQLRVATGNLSVILYMTICSGEKSAQVSNSVHDYMFWKKQWTG